jgi:hypothetical protein
LHRLLSIAAIAALTIVSHAQYSPGFLWNRQTDWYGGDGGGTSAGNPNRDFFGNFVWHYTTTAGGRLGTVDAWWRRTPGSPLGSFADPHSGFTRWYGGSTIIYRNEVIHEHGGSACPFIEWWNPTERWISVSVQGTFSFSWYSGAENAVEWAIVRRNRTSGQPELLTSGTATLGGSTNATFDLRTAVRSDESIAFTIRATAGSLGFYMLNDSISVRYLREADCNGDGLLDSDQISAGQLPDANSNGVPDGCEGCTFTTHPQSQAVVPNTSASFSVAIPRTGLSYQWRRNGVNLANSSRITGVTTPNLTVNTIAAADQGSYDCVVTGSCGTVTSQAAALSCVPIITQHPPAEAILVPGASLSVTVPTNASYTYRWRQNGQNLFNIPGVIAGATTRTLTLLSDDSSLVGTYDCVLTNVCGSTTSDATFIPCPADFNLDGGIDGGDVEAFFGDWSAGLGSADLNQDGGVDGADLFTFFTRWEGGC